jgi:DNA modification methylase
MTTIVDQLNDLSDDDTGVDQLSAAMEKKILISPTFELAHGDCLEKMKKLPPQCISCVINDPPYGCTGNDWDRELHLEKMWECYLRVLKPNGTVVLFCCSDTTDDPLLPRLMMSRPKGWKFYTLVFQKANSSSPFQAKDRPMRIHEDIIVFYPPGGYTYNPQKWEKQLYGQHKNIGMKNKTEKSMRFPTSILPVFQPERNTGNPNATAKPVGTMEWLVKTFTNEGDTVLDNTMGSGTTGVACANTHRNFCGIELGDEMFAFAQDRITKAYSKTLREELEKEAEEDTLDPISIELPQRQIKFDVEDYMKFYEKVSQLSEYEETVSWIVKYINQYFCIVNGDSYEVIEFSYGEYEKQEVNLNTQRMEDEMEKVSYALSYTVRKPAEVKLRFRKCDFFNEQGKNADLYDVWSRSRYAREYSERVFDPMRSVSHEDNDVLNTFAGLKAEQEVIFDQHNNSMSVHVEDFDIILIHIRNLCGGNTSYYEYLLDWLAYPIQTGEKTNVAVISHGGQGCGKSKFFVEFMGEQIYGSTLHAKIAGGKQVGGDFNAHISGKMYLAIEEPNDFSKAKLNLLKDLITASTIEVNGKGTNQVFVDDYTNYVFTCNSIPPDMLEDDDRRYFIIQHNGDRVGDTKFFKELSECMETHGQEFYKFLKMRDIKHYVKGKKPPQTEIKKRLMTLAIDPIFKYLQHLAETDAIENYFKRPSDQCPILPWKAFFSNAVAWCEEECETVDWKKKPGDLKELLKTKLGDVEVSFEPIQVRIPDFGTGGFKNERCVLFPKTSDALMDLLTKKKVYSNSERVFETDNDYLSTSEGDLDDYEILLEEEAAKAELVELEAMRKRYEELKNMDKFDSQ